ncbi:EDD domain protein, DegV family [Deinococcus reticulitermitis]|uniref:EDD domain protein, DegV family n=1 Tax=Deinococcus reticulitermitis TaxID=856736 RepID=A0A1H6X4L7_9DEIO|nr:DegV family protein [Deinococcus reticulitermitis]SEJ21517.1 EDD domain protein, DegV family [Deinococcus reticulitermitis]
MTIAIVTDSTSDLSTEQLVEHGLTSVALSVLVGDQTYKGELTTSELLRRLSAGEKSSTSQPSPAEFAQAYRDALRRADQVLSLHISGQLSGTVGSARLAAQEFGDRVTVVDSYSVSLGLGMQVLRAAELAEQGQSLPDILAALERVRRHSTLRFTVDTLDFLRRNGRIGGAAALLGGLLNIKPLLVLKAGRVEAGGRARGQKKALADLAAHVRSYAAEHGGARAAFLATPGGDESRRELRASLEGVKLTDLGDYEIGPVVATHTGPGAVGLALEPLSA